MRAWAISWDVGSYDGDVVLSVWLEKSDADDECAALNKEPSFAMVGRLKLVEVALNKRNGVKDSL
jgi:hypothetical protein